MYRLGEFGGQVLASHRGAPARAWKAVQAGSRDLLVGARWSDMVADKDDPMFSSWQLESDSRLLAEEVIRYYLFHLVILYWCPIRKGSIFVIGPAVIRPLFSPLFPASVISDKLLGQFSISYLLIGRGWLALYPHCSYNIRRYFCTNYNMPI